MDLMNYRNKLFICGAIASLLMLAIGCGGDSGPSDPIYSGSSITQEERDGETVLVFEISISDSDGNPFTAGLLVDAVAFTPVGSFSVPASNRGGLVEIVLVATVAGEYRVGIDRFIDTKDQTFLPAPDNENTNGKVLMSHDYAP